MQLLSFICLLDHQYLFAENVPAEITVPSVQVKLNVPVIVVVDTELMVIEPLCDTKVEDAETTYSAKEPDDTVPIEKTPAEPPQLAIVRLISGGPPVPPVTVTPPIPKAVPATAAVQIVPSIDAVPMVALILYDGEDELLVRHPVIKNIPIRAIVTINWAFLIF